MGMNIKNLWNKVDKQYDRIVWNYLKGILISIDELGFITVDHIIWKYQFGVIRKEKICHIRLSLSLCLHEC